MDSSGRNDLETNVEVNGTSKQPVATYKPITEEELDKRDKAEEEMGKPETDEIDDGAKEKMLNDEQKLSPKKNASEVIFISENGDAKVDVAPTGPSLSGMGKEELMKYANDPFWVRLRWFLFIGFWVLWFAMLAGAVAIIVFAPKCTPLKPKTWWEKSPIVQLEPIDLEGRDSVSLNNLLDNLKSQHVSAISLASMLKSSAPGHITDFRDVVPNVSMKTIKELIKLANKKEQKIILELDPNHSGIEHIWFNKSIHREEPYTDYYVWASPKMADGGGKAPPNNWLSKNGQTAWQWNEKREQYYLHQFNTTQPDLNFNNSLVISEFNKIFSHWMDIGIFGFRLGGISYLTEDPGLHDEPRASVAARDDEYDFLNHVKTRDREENVAVLNTWRSNIKNRTNNEGLFALSDDVAGDMLGLFNEKNIIDLPQRSAFLDNIEKINAAEGLEQGVNQWMERANLSWPGWDLNGNAKPLRRRVPADVAESITLMSLLLPGTPILRLNDTQSRYNAFAKLADERNKESFLFGDFDAKVINGTGVFAYTRLKSGSPGYIVAYQSADEKANIDLSVFKNIPEEVSLFTNSSNYVQEDGAHNTKFSSKNVPISPKSTIVLTFVSSDHS